MNSTTHLPFYGMGKKLIILLIGQIHPWGVTYILNWQLTRIHQILFLKITVYFGPDVFLPYVHYTGYPLEFEWWILSYFDLSYTFYN